MRCPHQDGSGHAGSTALEANVPYSITSVARSRVDVGTVRPSALAAVRLTTSANLVAACTGRSAGFSPLRMRSTYDAAPRNESAISTPYDIKPPPVAWKGYA